MKKLFILKGYLAVISIFLGVNIFGQKLVCRDGQVKFLASVPTAIEEVSATNSSASAILEQKTGDVATQVLIKAFKFKVPLMEEHFNENYMESDKIPYSTLDAVIKEKIDFSKDGVYDVTLVGTLDLHGVKVPREIKGKLTVKGGAPVSASSDFMVKLADHKIKIPSVVGVNIAEELKVDVAFDFVKYEKK